MGGPGSHSEGFRASSRSPCQSPIRAAVSSLASSGHGTSPRSTAILLQPIYSNRNEQDKKEFSFATAARQSAPRQHLRPALKSLICPSPPRDGKTTAAGPHCTRRTSATLGILSSTGSYPVPESVCTLVMKSASGVSRTLRHPDFLFCGSCWTLARSKSFMPVSTVRTVV